MSRFSERRTIEATSHDALANVVKLMERHPDTAAFRALSDDDLMQVHTELHVGLFAMQRVWQAATAVLAERGIQCEPIRVEVRGV